VVDLGSLLPEVSTEQAHRFLRLWYGGRDGYVVLTRISSAGQHIVQSFAFEVDTLLASPMSEGHLAGLTADTGGNWNVYISCSTHRSDPTGGAMRRRGGKQTIDQVHGVWLDLDTKNEAFSRGPTQIDSFIRALEINPTMVVDSGSGGRHVYWRFEEPVERDEGELLCDAWWSHCQEKAGGIYIDKVTTSDRIMRLPGTVRWPKRAGEGAGRVMLLYDQGARASQEWLLHVASAAWQRRMDEIQRTREKIAHDSSLAQAALAGVGRSDGGWGDLVTIAGLEGIFNETISWDQVLRPAGWHYVGTDYEGRRHWARPGQDFKSAHTDYPPSPHVMNLFSNSPETGLSSLHAAGIVLSKMVVACQLHYGGDMQRFIESFVERTIKRTAPQAQVTGTRQETAR
jgi:hypothetical protein